MTGEIPPEIGLWSKLQILSMEDNQIAGTITGRIATLGNLSEWKVHVVSVPCFLLNSSNPPDLLQMSQNRISGAIPPAIGNLKKLEVLRLHNNQISGAIPPNIGNLNAVETIDLGSNRLEGPIPDEFYNNLNLKWVSLQKNSLNGTISEGIGDLSKLMHFQARSNHLSGTVPMAFGNLMKTRRRMRVLDLAHNGLTGTIPDELVGAQSLRRLYLSNNLLSGQVPESYKEGTKMTELWLNDNILSGTLPPIAWDELPNIREYFFSTQIRTYVSRFDLTSSHPHRENRDTQQRYDWCSG